METQKTVNLLNSSENKYSKFATKKVYVIDSESKGVYSCENPIKFSTSFHQVFVIILTDIFQLQEILLLMEFPSHLKDWKKFEQNNY